VPGWLIRALAVIAVVLVPLTFVSRAFADDPPVIAAAGDVACAPGDVHFNFGGGVPGFCRQRATSDLVVGAGLKAVLPLGDLQYDSGSLAEFNAVYDPTWGRVKSISHPIIGNHEGRGTGYYDYFNGVRRPDGPAGERGKGWYSFDVGDWHMVALNSNCGRVGCEAGSEQEQWLRADLEEHPAECTLAYWHHPRWSSGHDGSNVATQALWEALDEAGAEILLSGHSHDYERFAPLDRNGNRAAGDKGIRQFVVGTGGAFFTGGLDTRVPNSQVAQNNTFGVLFLTLHKDSYDWRFVPELGGTFTDSGTTLCRDKPPPPPPPPPPDPGKPSGPPPAQGTAGPGTLVPPTFPLVDRTAPVVSHLRLRGATFHYRVSENALVTFKIRRCTRRIHRSHRCAHYRLVTVFAKRATGGADSMRSAGRRTLRRLRPGRYRADLVATDAAGNKSGRATLRFRVRS
jgi:hypothetical protein